MYPVARGTGVAITAVLAGPLLGEVVSVVGGFGVASIISGIVIMSLAKMDVFCCECVNLDLLGREKIALTRLEKVKKKERGKNQKQEASFDTTTPASAVPNKSKLPALTIAVLCGMCISSYSIVDKAGVGKMDPIQFLVGMKLVQILFVVPYMLCVPFRRAQCKVAFREKKRYMVVVGVGGSGCYLIVLYVLTLSPSSYVTALREVSVVFGAALGVCVLKERLTMGMMLGVGCIVVGLVLIKMA